MEIINAGTNDDGSPHLHYYAPGEHVVLTPNEVSGTVKLKSGAEVDVTPRVVVAESEKQAAEIAKLIDNGEVA